MSALGPLNPASISAMAQGANQITATAAVSESQSGASTPKSSSVGVTANDFLTLLVTEMKNQDPTANTDPNQYINQLVNVNSLQQLISINETLTAAFGSTPMSDGAQAAPNLKNVATSSIAAIPAASAAESSAQNGAAEGSLASAPSAKANMYTVFSTLAHGNLSPGAANPAAERLARALSGRGD